MRKIVLPLLLCLTLTLPAKAVEPLPEDTFALPCRAAALIERSTGELIYGKDLYEHLAPASVTKIMTMLLVAEAVENGSINLSDTVTASAEREGTEYIAVILHGDSSADRFAAARTLLDYAVANYAVVSLLLGLLFCATEKNDG